MGYDPTYYAQLRRRTRELYVSVAERFALETRDLLDELIEANECGVALEVISETLAGDGGVLTAQTVGVVAELADTMGLESAVADRLRSLILKPGPNGNGST